MKRNNVGNFVLLSVLIIFCVCITISGMSFEPDESNSKLKEDTLKETNEEKSGIEDKFDELICHVNGADSMVNISCFGNERQQHFFFLPTIADMEKSYISIPDKMRLRLRDEDGNVFELKDGDSMALVEVDRAYAASFIYADISGGGVKTA